MRLEEIIEAVNGMQLYVEDVPIINSMLENMTPEEFTKCIEEILQGNLMFSDFKNIFEKTAYSENLVKTFESQYELGVMIESLKQIREDIINYNNAHNMSSEDLIYFDKYDPDDPFKTRLGITQQSANATSDMKSLYSSEEEYLRKNLLYTLTDIKPTDDIMTKQYKAKMLSIMTTNDDYTPADLLFFVQNFILPVDPRYQILTEVDREFMVQNNISEEEMKNLKAAAIFLQQKQSAGDNIL